ncbi:hypothetical protein ZOSMA_397G00110 [Zostera marina]|uniref:AN1-type domain-containing protein n=1 Tax=Zostera marina TaxID=29655 RepID=A0A0K9P6J3_ZOSMR|nr:hypothetical protein ZOSMA_397G00110 [Zostera marina]
MGGESCNLDKDDAEILKPSSSSPSSPSPPTSPPSIFCKPQPPPQQQPSLVLLQHEAIGSNDAQVPESKVASCFLYKRKRNEEEEEEKEEEEEEEEEEKEENSLTVKLINRCSTCRKRVGLAGFRCRCGNLFCARHRYSDIHHCSFDYKTAGREEIAKANPVIRAAKIIRI